MTKTETKKSSKRSLLIAVDIDGVLTVETEGWGDMVYWERTPKLANIRCLSTLKQQGHRILLFTARHEEDRNVTVQWLKKWNVVYDGIVFGKPHYDYIVDDLSYSNLQALTVSLSDFGD